jgi:hypothetical protein
MTKLEALTVEDGVKGKGKGTISNTKCKSITFFRTAAYGRPGPTYIDLPGIVLKSNASKFRETIALRMLCRYVGDLLNTRVRCGDVQYLERPPSPPKVKMDYCLQKYILL